MGQKAREPQASRSAEVKLGMSIKSGPKIRKGKLKIKKIDLLARAYHTALLNHHMWLRPLRKSRRAICCSSVVGSTKTQLPHICFRILGQMS